ncbi:MAG: DUF4013 domain-containing protein [Anaerolineae bacterium]|nr:DUF4013 domain-containing protein [Anaerolineae bacterium]
MDLGRAFGYPLRDPGWVVKLLIGAVLTIVTLGIIPLGYQMRVIRNVMRGDDNQMPEWNDFGGDLMRGIMVIIGYLVYYFPIIVVYCCIAMVGAASEDLGNVLNCLILPVVLLYSLIAALVAIPAVIHYAASDDFSGSFLNFGARFSDATSNLGNLVMLIIYLIIVQFVMGAIGGLTMILCGVGLLAYFAGNIVMTGHLMGQYGSSIGLGSPAKRGEFF